MQKQITTITYHYTKPIDFAIRNGILDSIQALRRVYILYALNKPYGKFEFKIKEFKEHNNHICVTIEGYDLARFTKIVIDILKSYLPKPRVRFLSRLIRIFKGKK